MGTTRLSRRTRAPAGTRCARSRALVERLAADHQIATHPYGALKVESRLGEASTLWLVLLASPSTKGAGA